MSKKHQHTPLEVSTEQLGVCHHRVQVRVPADRVLEEFDHAIRGAARGIKIPGFRSGKAPLNMLRAQLGPEAELHAQEHLFEHCVSESLAQTKLEVLRLREFDPSKFEVVEGQELQFDYEVETAPEIPAPDWAAISVDAQSVEATDEQLQEALDGMGNEHPQFEELEDGTLTEETLALCDLSFHKGDEEGPTAEGLRLGLQSPLYGVDPEVYSKEMEGIKAGENKALDVEFNEGFEKAEWIGEKGEARVQVLSITKPRPSTAEELSKALGEENEEDFRTKLRTQIQTHNEANERQRQVQEAIDSVLKQNPVQISDKLLDEEAEHAENGAVERLKKSGKEEKDAQKEVKKQSKEIRLDAENRLQQYFLLRKIASEEGIRVSPGDLDRAYREIGARNGTDPKTTKDFYEKQGMDSGLRNDILEGKVRSRVAQILNTQNSEVEPAPAVE